MPPCIRSTNIRPCTVRLNSFCDIAEVPSSMQLPSICQLPCNKWRLLKKSMYISGLVNTGKMSHVALTAIFYGPTRMERAPYNYNIFLLHVQWNDWQDWRIRWVLGNYICWNFTVCNTFHDTWLQMNNFSQHKGIFSVYAKSEIKCLCISIF